ncbi:MAG: MarR family winged helix-turn-helix transcriptional regulator [Promethearchaeota archaeon]
MEQELLMTVRKWIELTLRMSMANIFKFTRDKALSMQQLGALIRIHKKGNCNVSLMSTNMGISNAAASQLLDRMKQLELIERNEDPNDRRIKNLTLTQKGIELLHQSLHASQKWIEDLVSTLDNNEKKETITVLKRLISHLNFNGDKLIIDK